MVEIGKVCKITLRKPWGGGRDGILGSATFIYTCIYTYMYTHIYLYTHMFMYTDIHMYIYFLIYLYIYFQIKSHFLITYYL
jgi:hypothetical protein